MYATRAKYDIDNKSLTLTEENMKCGITAQEIKIKSQKKIQEITDQITEINQKIDNYVNHYLPVDSCENLACFIFKTLLYDGGQMQARLNSDNGARLISDNESKRDYITVKDINPVIDACPDSFVNLYKAYKAAIKKEEEEANKLQTFIRI